MTRLVLLMTAIALTGPAFAAQTATPYAGQQERAIKALSDREIEDLRAARGMGLAKAAELNSYPGPAHVLELAPQLHLTDAQRKSTQALFDSMLAKAMPLGAQIIAAERALDRAFAQAQITPEELHAHLRKIAKLRGELRAVHLEAHITQRALLNKAQIARYDTLRGYGTHGAPAGEHAPGGQHHRH